VCLEDAISPRPHTAGWRLALYPEAGEAGGSFHALGGRSRSGGVGYEYDPGRSAEEAARRARAKVRRHCAANGLSRFGTLTYRGEGCHDLQVIGGAVSPLSMASIWYGPTSWTGSSSAPEIAGRLAADSRPGACRGWGTGRGDA